jgi:pilus assembly protein CpaB
MQRYKPILFLGLAVVIGLVTSAMIYNWLQSKNVSTKTTAGTQSVAVAMIDLPGGTVLNSAMIKTVPFLDGSLPQGTFFSDAAALEGKVVMSQVKAYEPILKSRLAPDDISTGGVAAVIDPKKRAMAVKVDKVIGVSGFVHPGNHVDVLVTLNKTDKDATAITKIVLQNIMVLAAGTEMEQTSKNEKPVAVDVITLELMPEEAEKLAYAASQGKVQLALRNYTNKEEVVTRGITQVSLLSGGAPQGKPQQIRLAKSAVATASVEKQLLTFNVEVFNGNKKEIKKFSQEGI